MSNRYYLETMQNCLQQLELLMTLDVDLESQTSCGVTVMTTITNPSGGGGGGPLTIMETTFPDENEKTLEENETIIVPELMKIREDLTTTIPVDQRKSSSIQAKLYEMYVRYIVLVNRLEEVYDHILQPQYRYIVRQLMEGIYGRIIELKHDLVNIDVSEFSYNFEVLERLKLQPVETELKIPRYILRERRAEIEERDRITHEILVKIGWLDEDDGVKERLTELEAIRLIQMHERARQGRLRAYLMKEIRLLKQKDRKDEVEEEKRIDSSLMAAMRIQKMWRGYTDRCRTRRRKMDEMILIGMMPSSSPVLKRRQELQQQLDDSRMERYTLQDEYEIEYQRRQKSVFEEIQTKCSPSITEDIGDELRSWIKETFNKTGKMPDLPTEEQGGSQHIFSRAGTESEMSRSSARSSKESRKTQKDKTKSPLRTGDLYVNEMQQQRDGGGLPMTPSLCLPLIRGEVERFNSIWRDKLDWKKIIFEDVIYAEKYEEVELECRRQVDERMRQELDLLQAATGKKAKKSNKKTRRSGKKGKKKKEKDLTPDRTIASLYEELVTNGIIREYPKRRLSEFVGGKSLTERNPLNPTIGDIRQLLVEFCILPLSSEQLHEMCPLIRSILIAGPKGTGKHSLLHAICHELGAVLFDLTPANITGKYPGKSGLIMLMHLILKCSRLFQPSIIYMGDAERVFMKKIPKTDRTDPKRLKKDLPKLIKSISAEDRVLFIGITNVPWEAEQKLLQQTYNRFIYIPRPDYGLLLEAWTSLLRDLSGGLVQLDCSTMAKISDGYTIGTIHSCLKEVLNCRRKLQLRSQPLTHIELINALSVHDPVYREEEEAFESWWQKTPLGRARQRLTDLAEEQASEARIEMEENVASNVINSKTKSKTKK